jgi:PAS domain S-box-containing protein
MAERIGGIGHWRLDQATRKITWSAQMYAIFGLNADHPLDLTELMQMVDERDREARNQALQSLLATGKSPGQQIVRIRRKDGELRYLRTDVAAELGQKGEITALVGTMIDITDQRLAQLALARSEASYKLLAENTSDMMLQYDHEGRVTYVGPACLQMTGYRPEAIIGKFWQDFISPVMRQAVYDRVHQQMLDGVIHAPEPVRYAITHADGHEIYLEGRPTLIIDPKTGVVKGFNSMVRDITRRQQAELALEQARADAETATAAKAVFLANMSHELRTPLTAVLGFSQLIDQRGELPEVSRGYLDRVLSGGAALLSTVNDILDFSKLEAGQVTIKPRPCELAALARDVTSLFELQADQKGLALETGGLDSLPPWVMIDGGRVRQVLLNLIGNAMKFTEAGKVRLDLSYDAAAARIDGAVTDTGPGIDQDCAKRLFNRFVQDDSATQAQSGTGLGLAICKGLVEAMGGLIGVDSRPGEGSRFWFSIAAQPCDPPQTSESSRPLVLARGTRVLVADDNPANRALVGAMLGSYGADVTEAVDGAEAVRLAMISPFDLILMDMRMPNEDGVSATRRLRAAAGPNRSAPILAFSADVTSDLPASLFDGVVAKPIAAEALLTAVMTAVQSKSQSHPTSHAA